MARGLWGEYFRVEAALDKAGFRERTAMKDLPRCAVFVMVNTPVARLPKGALEQVRTFVSQGGGLVVLGGLNAYGNGEYEGSVLEELLPVTMKDSYIWHFSGAEKGLRLARGDQADWEARVDCQAGPCAWYVHHLVPKEGARVQVKAGAQPALISGTYGKGRVVACALTVNGNPEAGALPFWDWKDWPVLLGQAVAWAGADRPEGTLAPKASGGPKPLTENEISAMETSLGAPPKDFVARALVRPDARTAKLLFDLAVPEGDEPKCALDAVAAALLPYAQPDWAPRLKTLADPMNPNIETRKAALLLLGASRNPIGYADLTRALTDKRTELAAMDGLGAMGKAEAISLLQNRFTQALAPARLPEGGDRWKPEEFAAGALPAVHAAVALYRLGDPEAVSRLGELVGNLNLYLRIMWNASNRWPKDPQGQKMLEAIVEGRGKLQEAWEFVVKNAGPIPASQGDAFVKYAMTADDPVIVEWMAGAMEKSAGHLPKADWPGLAGARSGILARMSKACSQ